MRSHHKTTLSTEMHSRASDPPMAVASKLKPQGHQQAPASKVGWPKGDTKSTNAPIDAFRRLKDMWIPATVRTHTITSVKELRRILTLDLVANERKGWSAKAQGISMLEHLDK
jgi:hypothetical protein